MNKTKKRCDGGGGAVIKNEKTRKTERDTK